MRCTGGSEYFEILFRGEAVSSHHEPAGAEATRINCAHLNYALRSNTETEEMRETGKL